MYRQIDAMLIINYQVALTRFRRTLKRVRLSVRMLTHTLHVPPALSEIYGGPRPEWLRDILDYLPCLQSLIVSELPFFDHNAMIALRKQLASHGLGQTYNLRLLLAEREPNTTSAGIAEALSRFPALVYLDLSYTTSARDQTVLSTLSLLQDLKVLKLRGIGLKDTDAELLANAIGTRVRFLDLRNNKLTDMAVRSLMQACFMPRESSVNGMDAESRTRRQPPHLANLLKSPELDEIFMQQLTRPLTDHSFFVDLPHDGITHLYIADNQLTVEGVAGLLASGRLHVLDVGTVDTAQYIAKGQNVASRGHGGPSVSFPGAEKLIPILGTSAKENLTYLRVHHPVVTGETPNQSKMSPAILLAKLPGELAYAELAGTQPSVELDAANEIFELPSQPEPRFELADTSISPSNSSSSINGEKNTRHSCCEDEPSEVRRGSVLAPEAIELDPADEHIILNARGTGFSLSQRSPAQEQSSPSSPPDEHRTRVSGSLVEPSSPTSASDLREQKIRELLAKRPRNRILPFRNSKDAAFPYLHPSHVPHLETLVLTDVPSHVPAHSPILSSLIRFITACSNEELLATLQARSNYSLPPGRARINAEKQHSRSLFALRRLVLEITPVSKGSRPRKSTSSWIPDQNATFKSSTGDPDSENLWSAAMNDFSFFGDEECGIPENDPGKYFPMPVLDEKVVLVPGEDEVSNHSGPSADADSPRSPNNNNTLPPSPHAHSQQRLSRPDSMTLAPASSSSPRTTSPQTCYNNNQGQAQATFQEPEEVDLVAELAAFRRRKKAEYELLLRSARKQHQHHSHPASTSSLLLRPSSPSSIPLHVEGHWKGEVKIVRNAAPKGRSGFVDLFGNYFEKGYLYP